MKKKILRNTLVIITLVILVTFCAVTAIMYKHAVNVLMSTVVNEMRIVQAAIENNGQEFFINLNFEGESQRITLIDPKGNVIYDTDVDEDTMDNHAKRPEVVQAIEEGVGESLRNSDTLSKRVFYYAVLLEDGNILRASNTFDSIYTMMYDMTPQLIGLVVVITIVSVIVIRKETDIMVRPINEINLDHPLEEKTYEELMPLLNRMDIQNKRIRVQMEDLKQAEGMRREFSANVSHELKTPLMTISGYAEIISCNMVRSEDIPEFARRIHKEATRMTSLIEDIIRISRLDEQSEMFSFEPIDLKGLTHEIVDSIQEIARKRGVSISVEGDVPEIEGVRQILYDMLFNLCDNAVKYNCDDGKIEIHMGRMESEQSKNPEDTSIYWEIKDTGIGIPKEEQERIFERFYRVDKSHSRETGGTGLGLSIVKHGAIIHGADIQLESELNEGTRIFMTIPMRKTMA